MYRGMQCRSIATKTARLKVQEVQIPVPWGHIAGGIAK